MSDLTLSFASKGKGRVLRKTNLQREQQLTCDGQQRLEAAHCSWQVHVVSGVRIRVPKDVRWCERSVVHCLLVSFGSEVHPATKVLSIIILV